MTRWTYKFLYCEGCELWTWQIIETGKPATFGFCYGVGEAGMTRAKRASRKANDENLRQERVLMDKGED